MVGSVDRCIAAWPCRSVVSEVARFNSMSSGHLESTHASEGEKSKVTPQRAALVIRSGLAFLLAHARVSSSDVRLVKQNDIQQ